MSLLWRKCHNAGHLQPGIEENQLNQPLSLKALIWPAKLMCKRNVVKPVI